MATSEQREQGSRWLARKAIRRALMCLARAAEADDTNGSPQGAVSYTAQAMNECEAAHRHYQRAIAEKQKEKRGTQSMTKQGATCISCHFFTPFSVLEPNGRCMLELGTYCSHTRGAQAACNEYMERKEQK